MALTRELKAIITADVSRFRRGMAAAAATSDGFGGRVRAALPSLATLGKFGLVAGAAVGTTLAVGLAKAGRAAAEAEASNARLTAQLKALGQNTEVMRGRVDQAVTSLSLMSGFDDEDIQDAFSGMARASGDANVALKALPVTLDLARARQMDVGAAGKLVERVLAGNVTGLRRYGIAVDKSMTPTEALGLLQTKVAGQAKAFGETAAGGMERAKVATENAFERVGVALTPAMNALGNFAAKYLPVIAENIASALEGVIGWIRTNWPTISATIRTVFDAVRGHIQTVWVPIFQTAISVIRSVVDIVRTVWPTLSTIVLPVMRAIKDAVQSALGVVRGIFEAVAALLRGDFSGAVRGVGTIVRSIFSGLAGIITGVGSAVANAAIALARGMANGILRVGEFLISLPGKIVSGIASAISTATSWALQRAGAIGRAILNGIANAIKAAPGVVLNAIKGLIPDALEDAVRAVIPGLSRTLSQGVTKAVQDARGRLKGFASELAGMAATRKSSTYVDPLTGKTPAQLRSAQDKILRDRRVAEMDAAVVSATAAKTAAEAAQNAADGEDARRDAAEKVTQATEELLRAQQERDDFYTEERIANAEAAAQAAGANAEKSINDLTAQFNRGSISAEQFRDQLRGIIGGDMGDELGAAFSVGFNEAFQAALNQAALLARAAFATVTGTGGGETLDPMTVNAAEQSKYKAWTTRRDNFTKALAKAKPGGKWPNEKAHDDFVKKWKADDLAEWLRENKPPPRSTVALAGGGILRRAILAGEAGPEAVIPLDGGAGRRALARAMMDSGRMGGGGATVINLTFNGVLDAREAARRIQPELDKIVSLI